MKRKKYKDIPKFYDFGNDREKKEILINNYRRIVREVRDVCEEVLAPVEDFD